MDKDSLCAGPRAVRRSHVRGVWEKLVEKSGGNIVARAAVLAEGDAADRKDIIFLEKLPLLPND